MFRVTAVVGTPPTVTTTGCGPNGAFAGTVKLICVTPARPVGTPANARVAETPPTVSAMGWRAAGNFEIAVPDAGVAPVANVGFKSPSPVVKARSIWPGV